MLFAKLTFFFNTNSLCFSGQVQYSILSRGGLLVVLFTFQKSIPQSVQDLHILFLKFQYVAECLMPSCNNTVWEQL